MIEKEDDRGTDQGLKRVEENRERMIEDEEGG